MSNFFDDYLKLNPIEKEPAKEKEKENPKADELDDEGGGNEENDE